jgi:formylglycine-generating enzyme required for sulfatase activity
MERSTTFDDGVEMVVVPPGCFIMGSTDFQDAQPVTKICFDLPFAMDKYEVTNEQFNRLKGKAQNASRWTGDQRPREMITWSEVLSFCKTRGARLPTEAEWEYAARGPDGLAYPWGNDFADDKAVYTRTSGGRTADVGSMPNGKSWVGAFDMAGNVWEWTSTIQTSFMFSSDGNSRKTTYLYPYKASDGRENQYNGSSTRVVRGGSWINSSYNLRTAYRESRHIDWPAYKGNNLGFRCARSYP